MITLTLFYYFLLLVAAIYLIGMFIVLRLIVPFMGFRRYKVPTELPYEYLSTIKDLESRSNTQEEYLNNAYNFVLSRWNSEKFKTVTLLPKIFRTDLKRIWNEPGYLHCNTMNFILQTILVNSKFFKPDDVKVRHTILNFVQHQYLSVRVANKWIDVDPAGSSIRNLPLGKRAGLF